MASIINVDTINEKTTGNGVQIPGHVVQVVQNGTTTYFSTTSESTFVDTGISASITPKFNTSKILVLFDTQLITSQGVGFAIYRNGATNIYSDNTNYAVYVTVSSVRQRIPFTYLDSPSTTSSTTYNLYMRSYGSGTSGVNNDGNGSRVTLMEIAQ